MKVNERVAFYLRNRAQIDEWMQLPGLLEEEAHRFYSSLLPKVEAVAGGFGPTVSVWSSLARPKRGGIPPLIVLYRNSWKKPDEIQVPVGIALEWPKKPSFTNAYAGIRVEHSDAYAAVRKAIAAKVEPLIAAGEYEDDEEWWPAYTGVTPESDEYWTEDASAAYAEQIVNSLAGMWDAFAPKIDSAFAFVQAADAFEPQEDAG